MNKPKNVPNAAQVKAIEDLVRGMPELEENSDPRTVPERVFDFLEDLEAMRYHHVDGVVLLSKGPAGLLVMTVVFFAGELGRRLEDGEIETLRRD